MIELNITLKSYRGERSIENLFLSILDNCADETEASSSSRSGVQYPVAILVRNERCASRDLMSTGIAIVSLLSRDCISRQPIPHKYSSERKKKMFAG